MAENVHQPSKLRVAGSSPAAPPIKRLKQREFSIMNRPVGTAEHQPEASNSDDSASILPDTLWDAKVIERAYLMLTHDDPNSPDYLGQGDREAIRALLIGVGTCVFRRGPEARIWAAIALTAKHEARTSAHPAVAAIRPAGTDPCATRSANAGSRRESRSGRARPPAPCSGLATGAMADLRLQHKYAPENLPPVISRHSYSRSGVRVCDSSRERRRRAYSQRRYPSRGIHEPEQHAWIEYRKPTERETVFRPEKFTAV
jgi:hypothetical protein